VQNDFCNSICQFRTHALQQKLTLLNHLVCAGQNDGWNRKAKRLGCCLIDDEIELFRLLNWQVARLRTA
jgi:hypothetical protein